LDNPGRVVRSVKESGPHRDRSASVTT
jgi:hypothetical protein